jgi:hypothetical protein
MQSLQLKKRYWPRGFVQLRFKKAAALEILKLDHDGTKTASSLH